ncbi:fructose-bisphosphate aldolase class I [Aliikangiella marina]|uniref:Probable fructose-bisphosphate aldolase class 1 n=1 Tax=Aliikangiella marina TaxID=1712262 RepID=A0A545TH45_9GAMM|nr:class I fructose-bisphosphate aldolase [Aliikangiella marina]TQV76461.1 fructose-bisphosphate aldolase class I [Aliikangiella marina]
MTVNTELQDTINDMVDDTRGILAADESAPTIAKRFKSINVESSEENRRFYRSMLMTTPGLGKYISGVILFEETLTQSTDEGATIPEAAWSQKIVPGIKVDKGKGPLAGAPGDMITYGLDGLAERLAGYKVQGARFAKWREVYPISAQNPTQLGLTANAEMLARYAAVCQQSGIVPIVEPEVLMDGHHDIERASRVIESVLQEVFYALHRHHVILEQMILKPSMVTPGSESSKASPEQVAEYTLRVFNRTVPAAVPSINFLSGGQSPEEATENLNAINQLANHAPWQLSISYGRALQQPVLQAWAGDNANKAAGQDALLKRARLNSLARQGEYSPSLE